MSNQFRINGVCVGLQGAHFLPVPGFAGWSRASCYYEPGIVVVLWQHDQVGLDTCAIDIYNINPQGSDPIRLDSGDTYTILEGQCGSGWTYSQLWMMYPSAAELGIPEPIRKYLSKLVAQPDITVTHQTGAPGMNYGWHPLHCHAEQYGMCREIAQALDGYRRWQVGRPRHWRDEQGVPCGLTQEKPAFKIDTNALNLAGLNGYDVQHFDVEELLIGHKLLGWPMFLDQLTNVWCHAYRTQYYWQMREDQTYAGSMRTPAGLLIAGDGLFSALPIDAGYGSLMASIAIHTTWHRKHINKNWPIISPWYYGSSAGLGWFQETHTNYHYMSQNAQLACALARVGEPLTARKMAEWLAEYAYEPATATVYEITDEVNDRTHSVPAGMPGTGMHLAPALIMADYDCELRDHLKAKFEEWNWLRPESQYGVSMAYPWIEGW